MNNIIRTAKDIEEQRWLISLKKYCYAELEDLSLIVEKGIQSCCLSMEEVASAYALCAMLLEQVDRALTREYLTIIHEQIKEECQRVLKQTWSRRWATR